jgi:hypothetical protein
VRADGIGLVLAAVWWRGFQVAPWDLLPGLVIANLGTSVVAGTLITIVLAKVTTGHSGGPSFLVNTSIQVPGAAQAETLPQAAELQRQEARRVHLPVVGDEHDAPHRPGHWIYHWIYHYGPGPNSVT